MKKDSLPDYHYVPSEVDDDASSTATFSDADEPTEAELLPRQESPGKPSSFLAYAPMVEDSSSWAESGIAFYDDRYRHEEDEVDDPQSVVDSLFADGADETPRMIKEQADINVILRKALQQINEMNSKKINGTRDSKNIATQTDVQGRQMEQENTKEQITAEKNNGVLLIGFLACVLFFFPTFLSSFKTAYISSHCVFFTLAFFSDVVRVRTKMMCVVNMLLCIGFAVFRLVDVYALIAFAQEHPSLIYMSVLVSIIQVLMTLAVCKTFYKSLLKFC